ncbi:hypothetical protein [Marivirga sp.]|uniref:hypothetical protein n=1 Tax=Marivirga sp. TaxID=2018662 RepID=UPI003DA74A78
MKLILFITFYLYSTCFIYSQIESEQNKTYNLSAIVGAGINKFAVTGFETEDYPSMVTRLGFCVSRNVISNRFQLQSGINLFFRAKSQSPMVDDIYWYGKGSWLPFLDETATTRHLAFEFPITLRYLLRGDRSVSTGLLLRRYGPDKPHSRNLLASDTEIGLTIGIAQKVISNFSIGLDVFVGLNDFYHIGIIGTTGDVKVKSRSAFFSVAYDF